jgi:ribosomal protein S18 acetylase RimI-like enzyme
MTVDVRLRPATPADDAFFARVYASTRERELAAVPFTAEQRAAFLAQQFAAQRSHHALHHGAAASDVVVVDGEDAGRLIVDRSAGLLDVVDIALLPDTRGRGIGTGLLRDLLEEAAQAGVRVVLHVEHQNPARSLYDRLGFVQAEDLGVYHRMEWKAHVRI